MQGGADLSGSNTLDHVIETARRASLRLRLDRLIRPVETLLLYVAYLGRFVAWKSRQCVADLGRGPEARYLLYQQVLRSQGLADQQIQYLEFGVFRGDSIRWWVENNGHPASTFVGFDTFTGLAEQWGHRCVGTFSTRGELPEIDDARCSFEVGLFQEKLPGFLRATPAGQRTIYHLDADLYSSTLFVLTQLVSRLRRGDVVIFDEFSSVLHEFRALEDFAAAYPCRYEVLATANDCTQVALRFTSTFSDANQ